MKKDNRMQAILRQIRRFSNEDFDAMLNISGKTDEIDTLIEELNALGAKLKIKANEEKRKQGRIGELPGEVNEGHFLKGKDKEDQFSTIFENATDAGVITDMHGKIARWNLAAEKIFGWGEKEVFGKFFHQLLIPQRYRQQHLADKEEFLKTGEGKLLNRAVHLPMLCKNGKELEMEITISPASLKEEYWFIAFMRDINPGQKAETQIRELNATLEQKIIARTEELKASEKKYRNLFENNPMPMWLLEMPSLRFIDINEAAVRQYGYSREEFLSMSSVDIRPDEDKKKFRDLERTQSGNVGIWKHFRKDKTLIYAEITVHEITFDGKPARLILSHDVTEKRNAEMALRTSEARFRKIFDSRLIGFLLWPEEGEIAEANDVFLDMIGYTRDDFRNGEVTWNKITVPEHRHLDDLAQQQIRETGVSESFEKEYFRKDGSRLPVLVTAAAIDERLRVSCIMDIRQRKKMEAEIYELNKSLEQRVIQRTHELQAANKELESFSYSVSHDLRVPLRAIHGYSQMLAEDYESRLDTEGIRLLDAVKFNAKKMGRLVDDLLTFSRMGKRLLNQGVCNLNSIVEDVLADLNKPERIKASVVVRPLGSAFADASLIRHVFQNLISNALKYSSKKEHPVVEVGAVEINPKAYYVKDNGAGFDEQYYNKLFGVFQRLHGEDEFEGTGVGLAIVQRIVERHGGKVWAEGRVNEGATFYFSLDNHITHNNDDQ